MCPAVNFCRDSIRCRTMFYFEAAVCLGTLRPDSLEPSVSSSTLIARCCAATLALLALAAAGPASAATDDGKTLFVLRCAGCHENAAAIANYLSVHKAPAARRPPAPSASAAKTVKKR